MTKEIEPFIIGPVKTETGCEFAVRRLFWNAEARKYFALKFNITYDERSGKWHHFSLTRNQKDGLCKERHYAPAKDCECIRYCKKRLEGWAKASKEKEAELLAQRLKEK